MKLCINASACSTAGKFRSINEDSFMIDSYDKYKEKKHYTYCAKKFNGNSVFAVCDGMGGLSNGDRASKIVVDKIKEQLIYLKNENDGKDNLVKLEEIIQSCNLSLIMDDSNKKMGSTIALICCNSLGVWIANVGDSKIYGIQDHIMTKLSVDHNQYQELLNSGLVEQGCIPKHHNKLTQYLGIPPQEMVIEPHYACIQHCNQELSFFLCTDGVTDVLSEKDISNILFSNKYSDKAVNMVVSEAENKGSKDNITAMLVNIKYK